MRLVLYEHMFAFKTSKRRPRHTGRALAGLDAALEFATLGEYRVVRQAEAASRPEADFCWTEPVTLTSFRARGCTGRTPAARQALALR